MQAALEQELAEEENKATIEDGDDKAMAGTDDKEDAESEAGSEDLEQESSDEDDEDEEEEIVEADEDIEMGDDEKPAAKSNGHAVSSKQEVMAH